MKEGLRYYGFEINWQRCTGSCNTLSDLSTRVCVLDKSEDLDLNVFNFITGINKSKMLAKHHESVNSSLMVEKVTGIKSGITINFCVTAKVQKNIMSQRKVIFGILLHVVVNMVNMDEVLLTNQWSYLTKS